MFDRKVRDRAEVVALVQAMFGESCPGASSLAGELNLSGELSFAGKLSLGSHIAIAPRQRSRLNHAPAEISPDKPP
jgi:hypothetical protein